MSRRHGFLGLAASGVIAAGLVWAGCGGGGSPIPINPPPPQQINNTQPMQVNLGPTGNYVNGIFTTVTICAPGTAQCDTVPDVLVDTGSYGLRVLASATSLTYPAVTDSNGNPLGNCGQFQDSTVWGPVAAADVTLAGEKAMSVPIQIIGSGAVNGNANFPTAPAACTNSGLPVQDTVQALGANGILGIGVFRHDCGSACAPGVSQPQPVYFSCPASGCTLAAVQLTDQVQNPVWLFPQDNNGLVIDLPSISPQGAVTVSGTITFGIGTQSNNALGSAQVLATDGQGDVTTNFGSQNSITSFIDTGSNAIFFLDSPTTGLPVCSSNKNFYCPSATANLTATIASSNSQSAAISFSIGNAEQLLANPSFAAFNDLGGPLSGDFDWGLPFFFGRKVFFAINSQSTPAGAGPFIAF